MDIYTTEFLLVKSFSTKTEAAQWLGVDRSLIDYYTRSGKVFRGNSLFVYPLERAR